MCVLCDLARTFFFLIEEDNFNFHFYIKEYDSEKIAFIEIYRILILRILLN